MAPFEHSVAAKRIAKAVEAVEAATQAVDAVQEAFDAGVQAIPTAEEDLPRIYCIEGMWEDDDAPESSVEPMLEMLRRQRLWSYVRRDCATIGEMRYYVDMEWNRQPEGSVLYLATHGSEGTLWLSEGRGTEPVGVDTLGDYLGENSAKGCFVHLGGCSIMAGDKNAVSHRVKAFIEKTGAAAVSGYTKVTGWTDALWAPAVALELLLFSSISHTNLSGREKTRRELKELEKRLRQRFSDCGFVLYTRSDDRLG